MLLRELPKSLEVSGKVYKIHTDFRLWLGLQALFQEKALTAQEKALIACRRVYGRKIPEDMNAALDALLWFYGGGLDAPGDDPLQQAGRADMAAGAAGPGDGGKERLTVRRFWTGSRTRRRSGQTLSSITEKTCAGRGCTGGTSWHFLPPFRKGASSAGG